MKGPVVIFGRHGGRSLILRNIKYGRRKRDYHPLKSSGKASGRRLQATFDLIAIGCEGFVHKGMGPGREYQEKIPSFASTFPKMSTKATCESGGQTLTSLCANLIGAQSLPDGMVVVLWPCPALGTLSSTRCRACFLPLKCSPVTSYLCQAVCHDP